jgi:acyl-CoA thioester hydrolase
MHQYKLRVYYEDTDAQGVVYYANYLKFFERARTELLRTAGYEQKTLMEEGAIFVVRDLSLALQKPARLDDELTISTKLTKLGKVTFNFRQEAFRGDVLLCSGDIRCGCIDGESFTPYALPDELYSGMKNLL